MIIQYYIDWESVRSSTETEEKLSVAQKLLHLASIVRRNGCVIRTPHVLTGLTRWVTTDSRQIGVQLQSVLLVFASLYQHALYSRGLEGGADATDDLLTLQAWKEDLAQSGFDLGGEKRRCVKISGERGTDGDFYCRRTMDELLAEEHPLRERWLSLQNFNQETRRDFEAYVRAFSATALETIRIYDPYLMEVVRPLKTTSPLVFHHRVKAWRNSLAYWIDMLVDNNSLKRVEFITCMTDGCSQCRRDGLKLKLFEVVRDVVKLPFNRRRRSLELRFHIVETKRTFSFHDRFVSNGRGCFAIGHGMDVCAVDDRFMVVKRSGVAADEMVLRNNPSPTARRLEEFNVFFGCLKADRPGFFVFGEDVGPEADRSSRSMYPQDCFARNYGEEHVREKFDFPTTDGVTPYVVTNAARQTELTVHTNHFEDGNGDF